MKHFFFVLICIGTGISLVAQNQWKPVAGKIDTQWSADVKAENPLPEYTRPQLTRKSWISINGLWQYAIIPKQAEAQAPAAFDGNILVPYAVESSLSGVGKNVG